MGSVCTMEATQNSLLESFLLHTVSLHVERYLNYASCVLGKQYIVRCKILAWWLAGRSCLKPEADCAVGDARRVLVTSNRCFLGFRVSLGEEITSTDKSRSAVTSDSE